MIRAATLDDVGAIVDMARKFYATTDYANFAPFDETAMTHLVAGLVDHVLLIAEQDGQPVGMVGLMVSPFLFSPSQTFATEIVWWVEESARSNGVGIELLRAVEPACKQKGCTSIQMMHLATSPKQAGLLYQRLGYRHSETSYFKVI
ncbi:GNAT family N-acetyltransferase [Luteimonas sp. FXH3W]|uniref:GNAT family N-acetyltransferase n=1 Tax=Aquilutibacter rugosus TaxID=3115820 RepID=A0ABU7V0V2_9GAMM